MSNPKEALERLKAENATLRASLKWVPQVQPGHLNGGAYVSMTWDEFNAMRGAIGLRPAPYRGSDAKAATNAVNMALRVKLETAEADRTTLIAKLEGLEREVADLTEQRDEAVNWSAIVDRHGTDAFDELGDRWLAMPAIKRMYNAVASVFSNWADDELMGRFKNTLTAITHQAFVEGCLVGVRAERARALLPTVPVEGS